MAIQTLHVHPARPANTKDLGDATRIVAICLVPHHGQRGGDLACLEEDRVEANSLQAECQILRGGHGLERNRVDVQAEVLKAAHDRVDVSGDLCFVLGRTTSQSIRLWRSLPSKSFKPRPLGESTFLRSCAMAKSRLVSEPAPALVPRKVLASHEAHATPTVAREFSHSLGHS